jgi:protein-L-isoaspartate(D-aspartate) O-methyltransferase
MVKKQTNWLSAPHMHAMACENMLERLGPGTKVLDVGSGSGYLTAVLSHIVAPGGKVIGVEHIHQLVELSEKNLSKDPVHKEMMENGTIQIVKADGRLGYPEGGEFSLDGGRRMLWDG